MGLSQASAQALKDTDVGDGIRTMAWTTPTDGSRLTTCSARRTGPLGLMKRKRESLTTPKGQNNCVSKTNSCQDEWMLVKRSQVSLPRRRQHILSPIPLQVWSWKKSRGFSSLPYANLYVPHCSSHLNNSIASLHAIHQGHRLPRVQRMNLRRVSRVRFQV